MPCSLIVDTPSPRLPQRHPQPHRIWPSQTLLFLHISWSPDPSLLQLYCPVSPNHWSLNQFHGSLQLSRNTILSSLCYGTHQIWMGFRPHGTGCLAFSFIFFMASFSLIVPYNFTIWGPHLVPVSWFPVSSPVGCTLMVPGSLLPNDHIQPHSPWSTSVSRSTSTLSSLTIAGPFYPCPLYS